VWQINSLAQEPGAYFNGDKKHSPHKGALLARDPAIAFPTPGKSSDYKKVNFFSFFLK
jgi:hypothetical protein